MEIKRSIIINDRPFLVKLSLKSDAFAAPSVTIITPDALRLAHEPQADCARYDSLRRAS